VSVLVLEGRPRIRGSGSACIGPVVDGRRGGRRLWSHCSPAAGLAASNPADTGQPGAECGEEGATMEPGLSHSRLRTCGDGLRAK
jgi:hypothetical protein